MHFILTNKCQKISKIALGLGFFCEFSKNHEIANQESENTKDSPAQAHEATQLSFKQLICLDEIIVS